MAFPDWRNKSMEPFKKKILAEVEAEHWDNRPIEELWRLFQLKLIKCNGANLLHNGGTCNFTVTGTIDAKFDYGYFVNVRIGSQLLHGILYHIHQHQIGSPPSVLNPDQPVSSPVNPVFQNPSPCSIAAATMVNANLSYMSATKSARRRRRLKNRDPARPKPNRSAYNFFLW
ncbi:hypothetical protein IEQ34_014202 [Dendrobium chrysotoxum]|uniref:Uncharacterized protein n=1 Tax=Dendrobium chrysotoxum TaxID=161865 RepID=A0AAV7GJA5_DENCH|nr:hypothetical protein IEQ34_014202 [Dendrobium chrysotoxum]